MSLDAEQIGSNLAQPMLFELTAGKTSALELFPKVWGAAEAIVDANVNNRRSGLETLAKMRAVQLSPLVAYLVCTRLTEPDLELRMLIVDMIGKALLQDEYGEQTLDEVRRALLFHLGHIDLNHIMAIVETATHNPILDASIAAILKSCLKSGDYLIDIALDRKNGVNLRKQAIYFLGRVGYVDSTPSLERLILRLESRVNGQQSLPFTQVETTDEVELLPILKSVYAILQAP
jgi:hypothetical protein